MSQNMSDFLRDPIWQFVGVVLGFTIGVLGLLVAIFALSDPWREICFASSIFAITFILMCLYILIKKQYFSKSLSKREKINFLGIGILVIIVVSLTIEPMIISYASKNTNAIYASKKLPPMGTVIYSRDIHLSNSSTSAIAWSPDGKRIADASGSDGIVQIWDALTGKHPVFYKESKQYEQILAWSHDSTRIAFIGSDGTVQVGLADRNSVASSLPLDLVDAKQPADALAWSPDDQYIAIGDSEGNVGIWDLNYWQGSARVEKYPGLGAIIAWSPDGKELAIAGFPHSQPSSIEIWDVSSFPHKRIHTYPVEVSITDLAWSPNGKFIAVTTAAAHTVYPQIWDVSAQSSLLQGPAIRATSLAWSCDSNRIAFGDENAVTIWDNASNKALFRFTDIIGPGSSDWSPDGMLIASISLDGKILVWQASDKSLCAGG
jgi:WD40 repeat protein